MSVRRFNLTLPCNSSMDYYPSNTVARYTTKLPQVTELAGDWEVALTEISISAQLPNVTRDNHFFTLSSVDSDETHKYTLQWGYYDSPIKVALELNATMRITGVAFRYQSNRIKLLVNGPYGIEFSNALAHTLGFVPSRKYTPRRIGYIAPEPTDLFPRYTYTVTF